MSDDKQRPTDASAETGEPIATLAERDRLLSALVESSDYAIITHTLAGIVTSWNKAAERLYEYPAAEAIGRHYTFVVPEEHLGEVEAVLAKIASGQAMDTFETIRLTRSGRKVDVALNISPVKAVDGAVIGVAKIARDITEQKRLAEQLLASQRMESVGKLAGGVAHDINNILMIIVMQADLLLDEFPADDPARARVQGIIGAVDRGSDLIRQLLAFSRKEPIEPRLTDINELIEKFAGMLRRTLPESTEVVIRPGADLWQVFADPSRIEQVVMNLALNAQDAMPGGGLLTIETRNVTLDRATDGLAAGDYIELAVRDTGKGVAADILPRIFDPFFTTKPAGSGSGLGLSTCHGIVSQAGGTIKVASTEGGGTAFRVLLPRAQPAPAIKPVADAMGAPPGGGKVLLAEDEPVVRSTITRVLTSAGYTVVSAASGNEAKALLTEHHGAFDMVLTDIIMPNGTGRDLAEFVDRNYPAIRVVFMTGYTDDPLVNDKALRESRGWQVLQKPFRPHALLATIRDVFDSRNRTAPRKLAG